jgi:uncharacterized protein YceK
MQDRGSMKIYQLAEIIVVICVCVLMAGCAPVRKNYKIIEHGGHEFTLIHSVDCHHPNHHWKWEKENIPK